ncbi:MAG: hypothetical protein HZA93_00755 [Verrucomicrobia bacterium]|nr:hypothetical protein [Verrucomicrobiota bacterium]
MLRSSHPRSAHFHSSRGLSRAGSRGSLLIVAMLLAAAIGIFLGSYLALGRSSLKLANRSFYINAATNIAETGLEEALWSFNQTTAGSGTAWNDWNTSDGVSAKRRFTDFVLSGNISPLCKVYVDHYISGSASQPIVVAQSTLTLPNESRTISKMVEVQLRRRSKFAMGLVARNQITFNGNNAAVDSWNSDPDGDGTSTVPYSSAVRNDHGSVGSTSVAVGSVAVNNADIWGFASVGSSGTSGISVGTNGTVASFAQAQGTVDTTRIATDFTANFDNATAPAGSTVNPGGTINAGDMPITFPRATDAIASDGKYYIRFNSISSAGNSSNVVSIADNKKVVFLFDTAAGNDAISLTGQASLAVGSGAQLEVYTQGNISLAGNGVLNTNLAPSSLQIWGTRSTTGQTVSIAGNGALKAIVYAPNANVTINGNGDVMGSVVGNNITVTGNASFHYDESLANWGGNNPYGIVRWRELRTAADRAAYESVLASF